jgi:formate dehydrogenase subunit gamma
MSSPAERVVRFAPAERWVHRTTAILMGVCVLTAAALYVGPVAVFVGHRALVGKVHVGSGLALPVPMLAGALSAAYRRDVSRLNRFAPDDWRWLRDRNRRSGTILVGKFNAGQKLNAAFTAGAILVMLGTGVVMRYGGKLPLSWRTGGTAVHDWLAAAIVVVLLGHLSFASRDPFARAGMRTGWVPRFWAEREHGAWLSDAPGRGE